ncbi:Holliday junction resolvase RuvX [Candidatus Riflebacteria bacterium]
MSIEGPILGIDPGTARIGLARSDPLRITLQPLPYLKKDKSFPANLLALIKKGGYTTVVVGFPVNEENRETFVCKIANEIKEIIEKDLSLPVFFQNERYSTQEAEDCLREMGYKAEARKKWKDSFSAMLILKWYCDANKKI